MQLYFGQLMRCHVKMTLKTLKVYYGHGYAVSCGNDSENYVAIFWTYWLVHEKTVVKTMQLCFGHIG